MSSVSKPAETQSIVLKPEALVLGGGIVGISVTRSLAEAGIHVTLLERGERLGGKALDLRTFYNRPDEVQRWIEEKTSEIRERPNVALLTKTRLLRVDGHLGQFEARVRTDDGTAVTVSSSVIVVATGYASQRQGIEGPGGQERVVGFSEIERLLSETAGPVVDWGGKKVERVTFLLDRVNEDLLAFIRS